MQTILIVDDNEGVRDLMVEYFGQKYQVIGACDGKEGLSIFKSNESQIKLVIADFNMPVMSGFEMIVAIRKLSKKVKIIVFSSSISEPYKLFKAISLSIDKFLEKPSNLCEIETSVEELLHNEVNQK